MIQSLEQTASERRVGGNVDPAAEIIVVGSGIAGSEVSLYLARRGHKVILCESGYLKFQKEIQALNDVIFVGKRHRDLAPDSHYHQYLPAELRGVSRVRQFGGTSMVWTGKWKYFQREDFDGRPWVPESQWPIDFDTLLPHYQSAANDYGFGDFNAEANRPGLQSLSRHIEGNGLKLTSFYWEEKPTRTAERFGDEMRRNENLRVILGATVRNIEFDPQTRRATAVNCQSHSGQQLRVAGQQIVLAAGAFETARTLLCSDDRLPGGIGNQHDLVGRFYSDHPKHHTGRMIPGPAAAKFADEFRYHPKPKFCVCFALDDATQRRHELLEHVLYIQPIYRNRRESIRACFRRSGPALRDSNGVVKHYRVKLVSEQTPNANSRVRLSDQRDPLGQRRLAVDWQFTDQDHRSMELITKLLSERFQASGLGRFDFGDLPPTIENMTDAAHQMGTTKMSDSPHRGVVDTDCRVFGTENLYIAGSAVFPTGPSYSPTFTILALARRLAEHLQTQAELRT